MRMFITRKRYEEEKKLADDRMTELEKTLHELYDEHIDLRSKYNQLLEEVLAYKNATDFRLETIEYDMSLRTGDKGK